ncbi:MAG: NAD(+) diphosphatase [Bifidobacteriaceae bacterium]|jgi:NAD+ diphosphatase|nr:NAD(+) diphosphatase [Bifidobacteriaceae bacterium]
MEHVIGVIPGSAPRLLMAGQRLAPAADVFPDLAPDPVGDSIWVVVAPSDLAAPKGAKWVGARAALPVLPPTTQPIALRALAVANWRQTSRFCPNCGGPVEPNPARDGYICLREDRPVFPRTDPCVITAIMDGSERLLLSHAANHPAGLYTLVAGFVEAGESLEAAVKREALEEVGIEISQMRFVRSQPWPFPGSLMASFAALAVSTEIVVDQDEITDAAWFTRPRLTSLLDSGAITLPLDYSVARRTIEAWRSGALTWAQHDLTA